MLPAPRRLLRTCAFAAAVGLGFAGGVVTGVIGSDEPGRPAAQTRPAGVLDEAAARIGATAARTVSQRELERAAVEGMLGTLGDQWSSYYDPAEFASFSDTVEGRYSGIGVWLRPGDGGSVVVGSVQTGSPSARAGVSTGDEVVAVAGASATSVNTAAALLRGTVTPALATGGSATGSVDLTLVRDGVRRTVRVPRTTISVADVTVEHVRGGVLHVAVSSFSRGVGRQVRAVLDRESGSHLRGVVLDLRGNPGGLLAEGVEVASAFLDSGPVVTYERRGEVSRTLDAVGDGNTSTPLVVLVDGSTASAGEVVAGALQDRNRAVIVGAPTYGKGSVQEPTALSDGSAIELTVGRYLTPAGRSLDGVGVQPDVLVRAGSQPSVAEDRALEVLRGLQAALAPAGRG